MSEPTHSSKAADITCAPAYVDNVTAPLDCKVVIEKRDT